ncbi:MAG: hypothetical protein FWD78_03205 [Treponema sp.]|nr:hypothetical protein [Treponema sp.]
MQEKELARLFDNPSISAEDLKKLFEMLADSHKESEITKREIKKYESMKEVMIQEITGKYRLYEFFFSKVFSERGEAIKKDFEIIDRGMKDNNRDLINTGVRGLSKVVSASPFADIEKLKKLIENVDTGKTFTG